MTFLNYAILVLVSLVTALRCYYGAVCSRLWFNDSLTINKPAALSS